MKQVNLNDFLQFPFKKIENPKLVNIRGCNGSGKSTIPHSMIRLDKGTFEILWEYEGKNRVIATVCPKFNFILLGNYHSKTGGLDTIYSTQEIKDATSVFWGVNMNLLMEGVLASTVRQTYIDLYKGCNENSELKREIIIYNLLPPLSVCLDRIQKRNGGKVIKEDMVELKWKTVSRNVEKFRQVGFNSIAFDNSTITIDQTLDYFFEGIGTPYKTFSFKVQEYSEFIENPYIEPKENLEKYDWYEDYVEPDETVKINRKYFDRFWWFIAERMNIWYKRVILREPEPWTDDKILQVYSFTNVSRDLDKASIWERKNILSKLDEPCESLELRKKSVLLNILIFRLFVKIETGESVGFIDLEKPTWKQDWEQAKQRLLQRRENGMRNFTSAFWINNLRSANPDPLTQGNKTQNAICTIENWINNIDELYDKVIVKAKGIKDQLQYFKSFKGIGIFNAYEFVCSIAETKTYCKNPLVQWTQDNATSVGIGSKAGLKWIFEDTGNMTEYECILYLRSIWNHELKAKGYYDRFISQLPKVFNGEMDLRMIEHMLCETHKYNKAANGTGRPRVGFRRSTADVSELV